MLFVQLCAEQGVTGYPTIYYYVDGQEEAYTGARSFEELSDFVTENLAKSCTFDENFLDSVHLMSWVRSRVIITFDRS